MGNADAARPRPSCCSFPPPCCAADDEVEGDCGVEDILLLFVDCGSDEACDRGDNTLLECGDDGDGEDEEGGG